MARLVHGCIGRTSTNETVLTNVTKLAVRALGPTKNYTVYRATLVICDVCAGQSPQAGSMAAATSVSFSRPASARPNQPAATVPERWRWVGRRHDYSFGIYIYAFPIQQTISQQLAPMSGYVLFALALIPTVAIAVLSWHFVEKRMLSFKRAVGGSTADVSVAQA